jgi:battenin
MNLSIPQSSRTFISFWIFGLVNNVLYVVILSAAIDLVGPEAPKAIVLLADILPSFLLKLTAPFYIHVVPYYVRIILLIIISFVGMSIIAFFNFTTLRLIGVMLASASSGLGEISFLQLTHFYDPLSISGWSSGTGAAGLVGSFAFLVLTSWLKVSTRVSLALFSLVPFSFAAVYWGFLPPPDSLLFTSPDDYIPVVEADIVAPETIKPPSKFSFKGTVARLIPLAVPYMYVLHHRRV